MIGGQLVEYLPAFHIELEVHDRPPRDGVRIIRNPEEGEPGIAVIRAHGIEPEDRKRFEDAGFELLDGTCGRVTRSQHIVQRCAEAAWRILIAGDEGHGEVKAVLAHIRGKTRAAVVKNSAEAEAAAEHMQMGAERRTAEQNSRVPQPQKPPGLLLIAQTTFSPYMYQEIQQTLQAHSISHQYTLEIIDSICPATMQRQEALQRLCDKVEAVVVVGGKASANTRRLYERALDYGIAAWHISGADELPEAVYAYRRVGLTAGASTPDWIIDEVSETLRRHADSRKTPHSKKL